MNTSQYRNNNKPIQKTANPKVGGDQSVQHQGFVHSITRFRHFTIDPTASPICWVAFNSTIDISMLDNNTRNRWHKLLYHVDDYDDDIDDESMHYTAFEGRRA